MRGSLRLALTLCLLAGPVSAEVSSNHGGPNGGSVRPGDDTDTCASGNAGAIRYNTNALWYCNGTGPTWTQFASSSGATAAAAGVSGSVQFRDGSGNLAGNSALITGGNGNILYLGRNSATSDTTLEIGTASTGNHHSVLDLIGDATYTDYGLRLIRGPTGPNTYSALYHRGTGTLSMFTVESAPIVFTTSGTESMRILANGNVGIGTSTPANTLEVSGTVRFNKANGTSGLAFDPVDNVAALNPGVTTVASVITGVGSGHLIFDIRGNDDNDAIAMRYSAANSGVADTIGFVMKNNGRVGVGTVNPSSSLHVVGGEIQTGTSGLNCTSTVNGAMRYTASKLYLCVGTVWTEITTASSTTVAAAGVSGSIQFNSGGSLAGRSDLVVDATGKVGIGTSSPNFPLTVSGTLSVGNFGTGLGYARLDQSNVAGNTGFVGFHASDTTRLGYVGYSTAGSNGVMNVANDVGGLRFSTGGTESMRILADGKVGIGTTTPATDLHISSSLNYTGTTPGANSYAISVGKPGAGVVGIGTHDGMPAVQGFGTGTGYNLTLNPAAGNVGVGTAPGTAKLHVWNDNAANSTGITSQYQPTLTGNLSANVYAAFNQIALSGNFGTTAGVYGAINRAAGPGNSTGTIAVAVGAQNDVYAGNKTVTNAYGSLNTVYVNGTGNISAAYGVRASVNDVSTGTITNGYGVHISNIDATNPWSVYASDASAPSYFAGAVGIGNNDVGATLDVSGSIRAKGPSSVGSAYLAAGGSTSTGSVQFYASDTTRYGYINAADSIGGMQIVADNNGIFRIVTGGSESMRISQSGIAMFNTTSHVGGTFTAKHPSAAAGRWGFGPNSANDFIVINQASNGVRVVDGATAWTTASDRTLKTDIKPLPNALNNIAALNGVTFHWKDPKATRREQVGVIAQDVQQVYPQLVNTDEKGKLGVEYTGLIGPLIEAVKTLKTQNEQQTIEAHKLRTELIMPLTEAVQDLKAENDNLRQRLEQLEAARR